MAVWGEPMAVCYERLAGRVRDAVRETDLEALFSGFRSIQGPTVVTGVGGSSVVSAFLSEVLNRKNGTLCTDMMPRDLLYRDMAGYENAVACSYSRGNIGVDATFAAGLKNYLYSAGEREGTLSLRYRVPEMEQSFVSLAGTLIPMALALLYYTGGDAALLEEILDNETGWKGPVPSGKTVEILYGAEDRAPACFLESTLTEGGLAAPVMHEKYNYCHGRCRLNAAQDNALIWFPRKNGLDLVFREELKDFYRSVTELDSGYEDPVVRAFADTWTAMWLCRAMAEERGTDICLKIIPPISEVLYRYNGPM